MVNIIALLSSATKPPDPAVYSTNLPEVAARLGVCPTMPTLQLAPQRAPHRPADLSARVPQTLPN